jgi:hypothetical protein
MLGFAIRTQVAALLYLDHRWIKLISDPVI